MLSNLKSEKSALRLITSGSQILCWFTVYTVLWALSNSNCMNSMDSMEAMLHWVTSAEPLL